MLFSLLKHHLDLNITDTALEVSRSLYCLTTSISHGVENYFPRLWSTGISDAIFCFHFYAEAQNTQSADTQPIHGRYLFFVFFSHNSAL